MKQITNLKNRNNLIDTYGKEVVLYIEEKTPTLVSLINQYQGYFSYSNHIKGASVSRNRENPEQSEISLGSNYIFVTNDDLLLEHEEHLVIGLAHELAHATGKYQRGELTDYSTATKYVQASHLGEAEAIYIEYQVVKEIGKLDKWRKNFLNKIMADIIEQSNQSEMNAVLLNQLANAHKEWAYFGGQEIMQLNKWNTKETEQLLAYHYTEEYQIRYLRFFTNLFADYEETTGKSLFSKAGELSDDLEVMAHIKSLAYLPSNLPTTLQDKVASYGLNNPDNFKITLPDDKVGQDNLKGDNIDTSNRSMTPFIRALRDYQAKYNPDELKGIVFRELIYGGDGNDIIRGSARDELILGGDGIDYIHANGGNDILAGNAGDDRLYVVSGSHILMGGSGYDKYIFNKDPKTNKVGQKGDVNIIRDIGGVDVGINDPKDRNNRGEIILGGVGDNYTGAIKLHELKWVNQKDIWHNAQYKLNFRFEGNTLVLEGSDLSSILQSQIRIENVNLQQFKSGLVFGLRLPTNRLAEVAYHKNPNTNLA